MLVDVLLRLAEDIIRRNELLQAAQAACSEDYAVLCSAPAPSVHIGFEILRRHSPWQPQGGLGFGSGEDDACMLQHMEELAPECQEALRQL
jgi:hypothetical protein